MIVKVYVAVAACCLAQIAGSLPAVAVSLSDTCIIPLYPGAMAII